MNGSSGTSASAFEGLTFAGVLALVDVMEKAKLRKEQQVRRTFCKNSQRFDAALAFLTRLGVVRKDGGGFLFGAQPPAGGKPARQAWILSRLLRARNRYRSEVFAYLRMYQFDGGELVYRPPVQRRSRHSAVRNFLMEMGVLSHDPDAARYVFSRDYYSLYARARDRNDGVSRESFAESAAARDALGLSAEREVMSFERTRLGPTLADQVDHVGLRSVGAGYDIRSVTLVDGKGVVPRYIEVKAVSSDSMRFYWTRNEMLVARLLQESYFLYLLPVSTDGGFDVSRLKMIPDPHRAVLGSHNEWVIETDVIRCWLRSECSRHTEAQGVL